MKLIKTESGIIAVSEELKTAEISGDNNWKNRHVIAGTPDTLKLKLSPEVATFLGVWDENEEYVNFVIKNGYYYTSHGRRAFEHALSLKSKFEFTEKDLYRLMELLRGTESRNMFEVFTRNFIQSLRNKEFEVESFEKSDDTLTVLKLK